MIDKIKKHIPIMILLSILLLILYSYYLQYNIINKNDVFKNSFRLLYIIENTIKTTTNKNKIEIILNDLYESQNYISVIAVLDKNYKIIYHNDKNKIGLYYKNELSREAFKTGVIKIGEYTLEENDSKFIHNKKMIIGINYPLYNEQYVEYVILLGIDIIYIYKLSTIYQVIILLFILSILIYYLYINSEKMKTELLENKNNLLKDMINEICNCFSSVVELKDVYTEKHQEKVGLLAVEIAKVLNYNENDLENIYITGLLHDIGKILINENILNKADKLTNEEYEILKTHPILGYEIFKKLKSFDKSIVNGIKDHHERINGSGYPQGKSYDISNFSQIIAVCDCFEAGISNRPYKISKHPLEVLEEMKYDKGLNQEYVIILEKLYKNNKINNIIQLNDVIDM